MGSWLTGSLPRGRRRGAPPEAFARWLASAPEALASVRSAPSPVDWRPALTRTALAAIPSVASRRSWASVLSYRSAASVASAWSVGSVMSFASAFSATSMLSIGSAGSILSIGSSGSILSIGASGSILCIGGAGNAGDRRPEEAPGPDPAVVRRISGLLAMAAVAAAPFGRQAG